MPLKASSSISHDTGSSSGSNAIKRYANVLPATKIGSESGAFNIIGLYLLSAAISIVINELLISVISLSAVKLLLLTINTLTLTVSILPPSVT